MRIPYSALDILVITYYARGLVSLMWIRPFSARSAIALGYSNIFGHCIGNRWICARLYLPGGRVDTPQFCSSDMSPQSLSPSQIHRAGIQRPVLWHWNVFGGHVRAAPNHITYYTSLSLVTRQTLSTISTPASSCSLHFKRLNESYRTNLNPV